VRYVHAYSDKAYTNDKIYIRSPVVSSISRQCWVSIANEEISDEMLDKPHFQGEANGKGILRVKNLIFKE